MTDDDFVVQNSSEHTEYMNSNGNLVRFFFRTHYTHTCTHTTNTTPGHNPKH